MKGRLPGRHVAHSQKKWYLQVEGTLQEDNQRPDEEMSRAKVQSPNWHGYIVSSGKQLASSRRATPLPKVGTALSAGGRRGVGVGEGAREPASQSPFLRRLPACSL